MARPTVLYQVGGTTVTTAFFESDGHRFLVEELDYIERVEHRAVLRSRLYELWAWYREERVRVFQSHDSAQFGQVCRALTRAREYSGLT